MANNHTWTDNPMVNGVSPCNPSIVNEDLMYLKEETDNLSESKSSINLDNLNETGEKHFLNKTQVTNCILEAPNGIAVFSDNTITVKQGLKVLIPNGRNTDGTMKNIEYTVPNDYSFTFQSGYADTFFLRIKNDTTFPNYGTSLRRYIRTLSEAPIPETNKYYGVYVEDENNFYYSNNGEEYILNNACDIAIYTTNSNNQIISLKNFNTTNILKQTDSNQISGWGIPDYSAGISVSSNYTAQFNCYITSRAYGSNAIARISINGTNAFNIGLSSQGANDGYTIGAYASCGDEIMLIGNEFKVYPLKGVNQ